MFNTVTWIKMFTVLLLTCAVVTLLQPMLTKAGTKAVIKQDGKIVKTIDLSAVKEPYTLELKASDGGSNTVLVSPGQIAVSEADCPDLICVDHGSISRSGDPIVCLPHKLVIEIAAGKGDAVDSVAQ